MDVEAIAEELEILSSIYQDDKTVLIESHKNITLKLDIKHNFKIEFWLPEGYPTQKPLTYDIQIPGHDCTHLRSVLDSAIEENSSLPSLYPCIEAVKEAYDISPTIKPASQPSTTPQSPSHPPPIDIQSIVTSQGLKILTDSETITDRKSVFQAHVCHVENVQQANLARDYLIQSSKKIAEATHNIQAYRIVVSGSGSVVSDCDDDGETAAGSRMLHLLNMMKVENVFVMVTRWYGGVHLGPDRFKHINNAARNALVKFNLAGKTP